ncbi:tRNA (cytidine(34)-2'-O)-methyltransferase [Humisphaera borealis]|uniref:Putative tRNA (cytidine(34)-2'-O)-methyltransferase n=1 Tax=Humisphaera borealis TaxID=2807512 RepID=A0A7M2WVT9_9BACT|nr:tRNA (cytidine(34)-2'-O)-methyltransferase [Humisphaera borealis]QOV89667.1 tRNA (cytidine(34)-2'-O)-methyltransferase [Humisphaera borealis]
MSTALDLTPHRLKIVLVAPQIAPNTGNIARLCVATGTELHLVRPLGFVLSEKQLRRSAMDYWPRLKLTLHDDLTAFLAAICNDRVWLMTSKGKSSIWEWPVSDGDWIVLGNESSGLPDSLLSRYPDRTIRIPQAPGERCLNLSTAAGVVLFEGLRQIRVGQQVSP